VNQATSTTWTLDSRFALGALAGAWRVCIGDATAVLKWHDPSSNVPYNPDAPAIVEYLRAARYPTPEWLAAGTSDDGLRWSLQDFVDGAPLGELDLGSVGVFIDLVDQQRSLRLPTTFNWNRYVRDHVFATHASHAGLAGGGPNVRELLRRALALAEPYRAHELPLDEMVHCDLNVSNLLMRNGELVAVVDIDAAGRGCAAYDLLSPAVNGVSWSSDPRAVERLVSHGLETYSQETIAVIAACLLIGTTNWYRRADPTHVEARAQRHLDWLTSLEPRLR
jgi:hypothetical protein